MQPFALDEVTLGPGLLADKAALMLDHLRSYDADRLLRACRENAGLPTPDVPRPGGWEDTAGEAHGNLRGHYAGHFLSALAQAHASTGDPAYADKLRYLLDGLAECQGDNGYLSAYPEKQFITLETMTEADYTVVWAPYYTAHKLLKGLLDTYLSISDLRALELAEGMCRWMFERLRRLPYDVLQRMWSLHGSGEYGGLAEAVCDLYAVTRDPDWVELGRLLDLDVLIDACAEGQDILDGVHANQHIPIFTGLVRRFDVTRDERYLNAAVNFWDQVVPSRIYSIGGTSSLEFWGPAGSIAGTLSDTNAETCCAHNLLKLSRLLFLKYGEPKYVDYYERTLYNQILGSKQDAGSSDRPLTTYFIGLVPGSVRNYLPKDGATCCEGTGLESATKYQDSIYFHSDDELYVNLYAASSVRWDGITVTQTTDFPYEQGTTLTIEGSKRFRLRLRTPCWTDPRIWVNGVLQKTNDPITRDWSSGDTIRVELPFELRTEPTPDDPGIQSVFYGPINLVALDNRQEFLDVGLSRLSPIPGKPLHFDADGIEFAPFFEGTTAAYHVYVRSSS